MEKDSSDKWLVKIVVVGCKDDLEGWISIVKLSITGTLAIISCKYYLSNRMPYTTSQYWLFNKVMFCKYMYIAAI